MSFALLGLLPQKPRWAPWVDVADKTWQIYHTGTASGSNAGNGNNQLTEAGEGWTVDEHAGRFITITSGDGSGNQYEIASNTADTLTITTTWSHDPNGQTFRISDAGNGNDETATDLLMLGLSDIPTEEQRYYYALAVEVEYTLARPHGSGWAGVVMQLISGQSQGSTTKPADFYKSMGDIYFATQSSTTTSAITRRVKYYLPADYCYPVANTRNRVYLRVRVKSSDATTGYLLTDVKARLLYGLYRT